LEFTHAFGGCTIAHGLAGSYLSRLGTRVEDRVNLIYTDTPFSFADHEHLLSQYVEQLLDAVSTALEEEVILIVLLRVYPTA
jgi:hypothetical protein